MFLRLCPGNNSNGGFAIALGLNNQTVAHVNGTVGLRSKSFVVSNNNESLSVTFAKFEKQLVKFLLVPCVETARRLIGKTISGLFTRARATATLCCSPPESSSGLWFLRSESPTNPSNSSARAMASVRFVLAMYAGMSTFSSAVNSFSN